MTATRVDSQTFLEYALNQFGQLCMYIMAKTCIVHSSHPLVTGAYGEACKFSYKRIV